LKISVELAKTAGIQLRVVSRHRFDESTQFLKKTIGYQVRAASCQLPVASLG